MFGPTADTPAAAAELVRDPFVRWCVSDIAGVKNQKLPPDTTRSIAGAFAVAGFGRRPDLRGWPPHVNPTSWSLTWPEVV
jgi:hypothetical protein